MKRMQWLLAALLITAAAVSCGDGDAAQTTDTTGAETGTGTAVETEKAFDPFAELPEKDYEGYEFNMLIRPLERWTNDMYVEEANGDPVDDAVFERNSRIEEKYNIDIVCTPSSNSNHETDGVTAILAGDDAYDLIVAHGRAAFNYANQSLLLDWNTELPYVNLDNPWWDQDARTSLSINDNLYVMTGDLSYCAMGAANVMLFNKALFNELDMDYPYQAVKDGTWTYEAWENLVMEGSFDLNGNGTIEMEYDRYGYVTQKWVGPIQAFATSGLRILSKDKDDIPSLSMMSDKTVEVFDWYFNIIDSDVAYVGVGDTSYDADFISIFDEGRSLFIDINMYNVTTMRSMTADFGIIPWPKYDESSEYSTNVDAGTNMCIVPITAGDPERTSIVLESMSAIGYNSVLPAYYEVALQTKASRDDESAEMLDIIKSARIFDLGYYNEEMSGAYANEFVNFLDNNLPRNFASWYEKNEKAVLRKLQKSIENYLE
ncbi:MAG: extracellular solute-binding protein [Clostridia bacterium]|nr:extracellular solute-binding protein [Clostridia bacterium]